MYVLKVCDVKNIYETRTAGRLGVPLIGYHLISKNDFSRVNHIKRCISELRNYYCKTKAILVTKERNVDKLIFLIKLMNFHGVQLHYPDSSTQAIKLKSYFGPSFLIIAVATVTTKPNKAMCEDFLLIDNSFVGGTGSPIHFSELLTIVNKLKNHKILVAGGLSEFNIHRYLNLPILGFDVQSALKNHNKTSTENIQFTKLVNFAQLLGYKYKKMGGQVGFVIQNLHEENMIYFDAAYKADLDFYHIDISDGFLVNPSNLYSIGDIMNRISTINSHIFIQIHLFISSEKNYYDYFSKLSLHNYNNSNLYLHINKDNIRHFSKTFFNLTDINFGLDVNDILDNSFPLNYFLKSDLVLCAQSKKHKHREVMLNRSISRIQNASNNKTIVTLDRNITPELIKKIYISNNINIVSGSYLAEDILHNYHLLKLHLHETK